MYDCHFIPHCTKLTEMTLLHSPCPKEQFDTKQAMLLSIFMKWGYAKATPVAKHCFIVSMETNYQIKILIEDSKSAWQTYYKCVL